MKNKKIKIKFVKVHNLDLEFTMPKRCRNYQAVIDKCPEGFRLPRIWELIKIYLHYNYSKCQGNSELVKYKRGEFLAIPTKSYDGKCYWFLRKNENENETFDVFLSGILTYSDNGQKDDCMHVIYIKKNKEELKRER